MGVSEEDIAAAFAAREAGPLDPDASAVDMFEVWPENEPALMAFLALETQWLFHPLSGLHTGLNWASLNQVISDLRLKDARAVRADVRVMEGAVVREMRVIANRERVRDD